MFGLKRRAREREAKIEAEIAQIGAEIFDLLCDDVHLVLGFLLEQPETTKSDADRFRQNAIAFKRGAEAVLIYDVDAYGPKFQNADRATKCGALIGHAARNTGIISGTYGEIYRDDVIRAVQLPHQEKVNNRGN